MGVRILMKKLLAVISVCIFASVAFSERKIYAAETDKNDRLNYTQHESVASDVNCDGEFMPMWYCCKNGCLQCLIPMISGHFFMELYDKKKKEHYRRIS